MVSVIIPCYNRSDLLKITLESFMNQTVKELEIIVVDGGSTDGTLEQVKKMGQEDPRIQLIEKPSSFPIGPSSSRNLGLKKAKGDFICFSDDDDLQHPESIERRLKKLNEDPELVYVSCNKQNFTDDSELDGPVLQNPSNHGPLVPDDFREYVAGNLWINTAGPLIRRSFFDTNLYREDLYYGDDWEFNLRLILGGKGWMLPDRLIYHRMHPDSTTVSVKDNPPRFQSGLRARMYGYEMLSTMRLTDPEVDRAFFRYYLKRGDAPYFKDFLKKSSYAAKYRSIYLKFQLNKLGIFPYKWIK